MREQPMREQAVTQAARTNLAPITMECDAPFLKVQGELPRELNGTLYRNGPNPQFDAHDAGRPLFSCFGRKLPDTPASITQDGGVANTNIIFHAGRLQLAAEAAEQRAAGVMLGLPFRGADTAVAVAGAAVLEMEGVQHAVADEPVRARRVELRIGAIAVERALELAR